MNTANKANRLLLIDDDQGVREYVRDVAEELGYAVVATESAEEFFVAFRAFVPTLIMVDLVMPHADGVELLRRLSELPTNAEIVVMSGLDSRVLGSAERLGDKYGLNMLGALSKPIALPDLEALLRGAWDAREEVTALDLKRALEKEELAVHYQPKVRLDVTDALPLDGAEALVRWEHPKHGLVGPNEFIPLAEQNDLMGPLTDFVFGRAISDLAEWQRLGLSVSLAVNLAPQLLTDLHLPDRLAVQLANAGIEPNRFVVEITERAAMGDAPHSMDILTRFRLKNIGLSMDDFGAGYSSLVELYRMPFSELKIDRSFICDIDTRGEARIIVRALVSLARNLNLSVCAEGVETESALSYLRSIGCQKAQGFLFSRALPACEFVDFAERWDERLPKREVRASA